MQYNIQPIIQCSLYKAPSGKFVLEFNAKKYLFFSNERNYVTQLSFSTWKSESFTPNVNHTELLYFVYVTTNPCEMKSIDRHIRSSFFSRLLAVNSTVCTYYASLPVIWTQWHCMLKLHKLQIFCCLLLKWVIFRWQKEILQPYQ